MSNAFIPGGARGRWVRSGNAVILYPGGSPRGELEGEYGSVGTSWGPPAPRRILIFFGYSGSSGDGTVERDQSNRLVALTLKEHLARRFPGDDIQVTCAWHKNTFVKALLAPGAGGTIRQIHYVGHGAGGGLYFGYSNEIAKSERSALMQSFANPAHPNGRLTAAQKRVLALKTDAGLMTGFFTDALAPSSLATIRGRMAPDTLMHVWGCFAGAAAHTYDTTHDYWKLFNGGAASVHGVARDIARSLGIRVTAGTSPQQGMLFWYRDSAGTFHSHKRPARLPQWLWPESAVEWVTYDAAGTGSKSSIHFLEKPRAPSEIKPGRPPAWLTGEIPLSRARDTPPAFAACSAAGVPI